MHVQPMNHEMILLHAKYRPRAEISEYNCPIVVSLEDVDGSVVLPVVFSAPTCNALIQQT